MRRGSVEREEGRERERSRTEGLSKSSNVGCSFRIDYCVNKGTC